MTQEFALFSPLHLATILGFAACWALFVLVGLRVRGSGAPERTWRGALAGWVLVAWALANGIQLLPAYFVPEVNLPLQVCDIAGLLAAVALWLPGPRLRALLYFWGSGFSVVAILTPELVHGPRHAEFWTFWVPHANLTGAACYLLVVERYRPAWADAAVAYRWALLYLALILPFDLLSGYNYGYVGPATPAQPTLLDWLGPWPWRLGAMMALTALVFAALAWPWNQKPRSRA